MKKELLSFIDSNALSPFVTNKTLLKGSDESIYKTKDAKSVHTKVLSVLAQHFNFADTSNLFNFFTFTDDPVVMRQRQAYFQSIESIDNSFLDNLNVPKRWWKPKYGIIVVTEDEKTFTELKKLDCPVKFLITQSDLESLDDYDIVQVIDCENFSRLLETLPQSVFIESIDDVYLERYLQVLSGWKDNLVLLKENKVPKEIQEKVEELDSLLALLSDGASNKIRREDVEASLIRINQEVSARIKSLTISGDVLFTMLSKSSLPDELMDIVRAAIAGSKIPSNVFMRSVPVEIDEAELDSMLKKQSTSEHTSVAESIKKKAAQLRQIPQKLHDLSNQLLLFDFNAGIAKFVALSTSYPLHSPIVRIDSSANMFLDHAQPISFYLDEMHKCSILTGANSGGKTTLLEHVIQLITLTQIGLPVSGNVALPLFVEVYYFAKNKGSLNKGAFETLLTQMSKIKPGKRTLILADEIESVTEPGVAGAIVCASAEYFIKQGCFLIIATHLGKEIQKNLPNGARIDGIEAKGLDEQYELIVDHNPVLGRLANSTPELIIEKMANAHNSDYFNHLHSFIRRERYLPVQKV